MQIVSILNDLKFSDSKPATALLLENKYSKEVRITFRANQEMREHTAPYPISVEVFRGEIEFNVSNKSFLLKEGFIITLDANEPHSLRALKESIVRLTLNRADSINRVEAVVK